MSLDDEEALEQIVEWTMLKPTTEEMKRCQLAVAQMTQGATVEDAMAWRESEGDISATSLEAERDQARAEAAQYKRELENIRDTINGLHGPGDWTDMTATIVCGIDDLIGADDS